MSIIHRVLIPFALLLAVAVGRPDPATAASRPDCTEDYLLCINEAVGVGGQSGDWSDELASIECGAEWAGCVMAKLKWW